MLMMIILAMTDKDRSSRRTSREARKYFVIFSYLHRIAHTLLSLSLSLLVCLIAIASLSLARALFSPVGAGRCCPSLEKEDKCYYDGYIAAEKTGTSLIRTSASFETIGVPSLDTLSFFPFFFVFPAAIHSFICFVYNFLDFSRSPAILIDCSFVRSFDCSETYFEANLP